MVRRSYDRIDYYGSKYKARRKAEKRKADRRRSREFRRKQREQRSRIAGRRKKKGEGRRFGDEDLGN
ncbi:hypothetical protein ERO13_D11G162475v2 [Gossypium hirsutum]|uniref:Uncharacterized protein n=2 Tax=Gossypium TaxID=3633 RepID=A0A0D2SBC2_GOSRA|nr:hypothetical protein ES319_D11G170100v1 [Gossypium barbadense]KAG4120742.1 hypothetical protein ERO13_D11G162475v2 [Gossypium hirsutum]KJB39126.1 hypothetical protein B456_007G173000 [Gossypium raimondii]